MTKKGHHEFLMVKLKIVSKRFIFIIVFLNSACKPIRGASNAPRDYGKGK